ncbi:MAG: hypothetical protein IJT28_08270 [Bacteroidaceae bacterium]|nr:hypothetical protein [Bacteroidaceae bacterium]
MYEREGIDLREEYLQWLTEQVSAYEYTDLLAYLYDTQFIFVLDRDRNRAEDGIDLRFQFGYDCGYSHIEIMRGLGMDICSVLEMMVALALRVQVQIMDDMDGSDRTGTWFHDMLVSLGISDMIDGYFDRRRASDVIYRFMMRDYNADGRGGLFYIPDADEDMRDVEIWYQMQRYLNRIVFERS